MDLTVTVGLLQWSLFKAPAFIQALELLDRT